MCGVDDDGADVVRVCLKGVDLLQSVVVIDTNLHVVLLEGVDPWQHIGGGGSMATHWRGGSMATHLRGGSMATHCEQHTKCESV